MIPFRFFQDVSKEIRVSIGEREFFDVIIFRRKGFISNSSHINGGGIEFLQFHKGNDLFQDRHLSVIFPEKQVDHLISQGCCKAAIVLAAVS